MYIWKWNEDRCILRELIIHWQCKLRRNYHQCLMLEMNILYNVRDEKLKCPIGLISIGVIASQFVYLSKFVLLIAFLDWWVICFSLFPTCLSTNLKKIIRQNSSYICYNYYYRVILHVFVIIISSVSNLMLIWIYTFLNWILFSHILLNIHPFIYLFLYRTL